MSEQFLLRLARLHAVAQMDVSTVIELTKRYDRRIKKGHFERADVLLGLALHAAEALGAEGCLIVVHLRFARLVAMFPGYLPAWPWPRAAVNYLLVTMCLVTKRAAAGTLLSNCRPAECLWMQEAGCEPVHLGKRVGYQALASAGAFAAYASICRFFFDDGIEVMADLAQLIATKSATSEWGSDAECLFVYRSQFLWSDPESLQAVQSFGAAGARLLAGWQRMSEAGVAEHPWMTSQVAIRRKKDQELLHAAAAASAEPGLRPCALASCGAREAHPEHFKACAGCRVPVYCCIQHQRDDWPRHKASCRVARQRRDAA